MALIPRGSPVPTPWAVHCPHHGQVFLTEADYDAALGRPDEPWYCPRCGARAEWDDDNYEGFNAKDTDHRTN